MSGKTSVLAEKILQIKTSKGMKGLFAGSSYEQGEIVCKIIGKELSQPTRTSVQLAQNLHIDVKAPVMYINHSCFGNITLKNYTFVALRTISEGEEITFNYNANEDILSNPFKCRDCGQWVKGKFYQKEFPCKKEK